MHLLRSRFFCHEMAQSKLPQASQATPKPTKRTPSKAKESEPHQTNARSANATDFGPPEYALVKPRSSLTRSNSARRGPYLAVNRILGYVTYFGCIAFFSYLKKWLGGHRRNRRGACGYVHTSLTMCSIWWACWLGRPH